MVVCTAYVLGFCGLFLPIHAQDRPRFFLVHVHVQYQSYPSFIESIRHINSRAVLFVASVATLVDILFMVTFVEELEAYRGSLNRLCTRARMRGGCQGPARPNHSRFAPPM